MLRKKISDPGKVYTVSKRNILMFAMLTIVLVIYSVVFNAPMIGAANNGDFYRFAERVGIDGVERFTNDTYPYYNKLYELWQWKPLDFSLLTPAKQSFGNIWPITLVRLITNIVSDTADTPFSTVYLAIIYAVMLIATCYMVLNFVIDRWGMKSLPVILAGIVLFLGSMNLGWLNSFYGEAMLFCGLFLTSGFVCATLLAESNKRVKWLMGTLLSFYLFITAKPQAVLAWPFWAVFLIGLMVYACRGNRFKRIVSVVIAIIMIAYSGISCLALYKWNSEYNEKDTLYSSIMYGALMLTDTQEEAETMLKEMGLNPAFAADRGQHAYSAIEDFDFVVPRSEEAQLELYNKINTMGVLKYYILHPAYLYKALEVTAQSAIQPSTSLFQFEGEVHDVNVAENGRFTLWENLRPYLVPHHFWQYCVLYLILFGVAIGGLVKNRKGRRDPVCYLIIIYYMLIMLTGIMQYPLPFIGNGYADTNKQLYLFMLCWDVTMLISVAWGIRAFTRFIRKRHTSKYCITKED